ncbi:MAG: VWA domain-containing protein [Kiritimatiellae bacterium]|nr:VWA domain-containing protein [Kiritimatiellia bacterium]
MRFVYPWFLLFLSVLPLVALLWLWLFRRSQRRLSSFIAPALQSKLMPPRSTSRFYLQYCLSLAGLMLLVFAVSRPQWGQKEEKVLTRGRNVVIALDVSRSMLATDVHPNRLERAKTDIMDLIDDLDGDRAALLAFRNKGSLVCPLTTDYAFLRQAVDGISPESAPRGETDLGDAIRKSLAAFDASEDEYNAILLISDGGDLKGDALKGAADAAARNIPIFTVGIGDVAGATIPDAKGHGVQQYQGKAVTTKLEDKTLSAIAAQSNGRYISLGTAGTAQTTLGSIYQKYLRQIAAKEQQEQLENRYQERYQLFLIPALILFLLAAWFSRGRLLGARVRMKTAAAAALVLLFAGLAEAQGTNGTETAEASAGQGTAEASAPAAPEEPVPPGRAGAREAQAMLRAGDYTNAAAAFLSAKRGAETEEGEDYQYNAAYAYYAASNYEAAAECLRPLLISKKNGAKAGEFLGKIMLELRDLPAATEPQEEAGEQPRQPKQPTETPEQKRLEALEEAAEAFQRALRDTPQDERRNRNLTRAVSPLGEARKAAHIAQVMKAHEGQGPQQLIPQMLQEQRAILTEARQVFTNDAATMIQQSEQLAKRQSENADLWIPVKQQIAQAVTNEQQRFEILRQMEATSDSMKGTVLSLQDANPDAALDAAESEPALFQFWKAVAEPRGLLAEDISCQTNAISSQNLPYYEKRDVQGEALQLTRLFRERFPDWAKNYQQQAQQNTNMPPFTAEDQAKIEKLAEEVERLQQPTGKDINGDPVVFTTAKKEAFEKLIEILKLMPPDPNQQQQQQNQQQQQQPQQQHEQQQQQEQKQEQKQEKQEQQRPQEPKDVQELLRRALEREKEHEEEKKERMRQAPALPSEKDW